MKLLVFSSALVVATLGAVPSAPVEELIQQEHHIPTGYNDYGVPGQYEVKSQRGILPGELPSSINPKSLALLNGNSASQDLESMMNGLSPQQQLDLLTKLDLFYAGEDIINRRPRPGASPVTGLGPRRLPPRVASRYRPGSFLTSYNGRPTIAPFNFRTTDAPASPIQSEQAPIMGGPGREAPPYAKALGFNETV